MRRFLILSILLFGPLFSSVSHADFKGFSCTNYGADTVFHMNKRGDEVIVEWELKRGLKSLPLYEGVMNIEMLPIIQHQIADLKELDVNTVRFTRDISQCNFSDHGDKIEGKQLTCNGPAVFEAPKNQKFSSYTLMTSWTQESFLDWSYKTFKIRVGLDTLDMHYLITFVFDPAKCTFR